MTLKLRLPPRSLGTFQCISSQHFPDADSLIQSKEDKDYTFGWLSLLTGVPVYGVVDSHAVELTEHVVEQNRMECVNYVVSM